jgi:signal transduction histidine kinase
VPQDTVERTDNAQAQAVPPVAGRGLWRVPPVSWRFGLSAKLLVLTIAFVMLAEVLIFLPSVANYRINWLSDRLVAARLASLAASVSPGGAVPEPMRQALLSMAQVKAVALKQGHQRLMVLPPSRDVDVAATYDLRVTETGPIGWLTARAAMIAEALAVLHGPPRIIRVIGRPAALAGMPDDRDLEFVEVVMPEHMLRADMLRYSLNILGLSIVISLIAASLIYMALNRMLVLPMMRLARNMVHFAERPEDASRIIEPGVRVDEVGVAERELHAMQTELSQLLLQKSRLAQLGLAVAKINHDLRNMLATAQLMSDRLSGVADPTVQRFAPKLIASLDRAIAFCNDTVRFGRSEEAAPRREPVPLAALVREVGEGLGLPRSLVDYRIEIPEDLRIDADRDHLYRVLNNIVRNAVHVLEQQPQGQIRVSARRQGAVAVLEISDDGPGLPARARANLFQAFQGGARKGGTGLGLAIAAELIAAHGGSIRLLDRDKGATFEIEIPDRVSA